MAAHPYLRRASRLLLALMLLALAVWPPAAQASAPPFRGEYYNNRDLSGAPVMVRDDPSVNFDWGNGSPGSPVHVDDFSVRWTNFVSLGGGNYRFTVRTDDGVRLWVDEALLVDRWAPQPPTTYNVDRYLSAGYHSIRMEYFEAGGGAVAQLSWAPIGAPPAYPDWRGEYFPNVSLEGTPKLVRNDTAINFNWGYGSPAIEVPPDLFSVRWTRQANFPTAGTYVFTAVSDDGIRVKVDGTWVINRWQDQPATTTKGSITLSPGAHAVTVEYYERGGEARASLSWAAGSAPPSTTVVVDDLDPQFTRGGTLSGFQKSYYGYRNHLFWVWNSASTADYWGRWTPQLTGAGNYEVQVYIPRYYFGTTSARYRILHNGVRHDRIVSQAMYYDQWVSLGTYYFSAGGGEYVFLANNTGEPYATHPVGFDAVRFIPTGAAPPPEPPPGSSCAITPVSGFGDFWRSSEQVRACIGCPTEAEHNVWLAEESFTGGLLLWRQDNDTIYVLFNDGTWQQFPNPWLAGEAETDPSLVPPSGYYQPKRGFGELWRTNGAVRNRLGWATVQERGLTGAAEAFERGLMIWSPDLGIFALCNNGRWYRP